jgi:hypothetical protein
MIVISQWPTAMQLAGPDVSAPYDPAELSSPPITNI